MSYNTINNRDYRTSLKTINFSYLNAGRSADALTELHKSRPRDIIYFISEVALRDNYPIPLEGYYSIYAEPEASSTTIRTCAYFKESASDCLESFTCHPDYVTVKLIDHWSLTACYVDPQSEILVTLLKPLTDRQMILGDFNAKNQSWFDLRPNDYSMSMKRGLCLHKWAKKYQLVERGPREPTRYQHGFQPSKLDLMWTTRHPMNFLNFDYSPTTESDHCVIAARLRLIRNPRANLNPSPNYKKIDTKKIREVFEQNAPPHTATQLDNYLKLAVGTIPLTSKNPIHRLPPELLATRRDLRHAMKTRWGSQRYNDLRRQYRNDLANHINNRIENTLDSARDPEFYQFCKRGQPSKPVPALSFRGQTYSGHQRIAQCLAEYHGANNPVPARITPSPDIPPVTPAEVSAGLSKAPPTSANGPDNVNLEILRILQSCHPTCLSDIYTRILREGKHPRSWKLATVVPIPKANKPSYTVPKSWRSIHLLNVVSKTLERIVLARLQLKDSPDDPTPPMGPTQFGSRESRGTSDAMQCLTGWLENAHSKNHYFSLIATDIEGGFDKVLPSHLNDSDLDPLYIPWIQHWTSNREIKFRHNNRFDLKTYTINNGIPQGSPLSPFLFGAYIKKVMKPRMTSSDSSSTLVISYVDDVLICVSSSDQSSVQQICNNIWADIQKDASDINMSFAENKTKTWHDRLDSWGIGTVHPRLRFLGYWIETPPPLPTTTASNLRTPPITLDDESQLCF